MEKVIVSFYKTVCGQDQLKTTKEFNSMSEAKIFGDEWVSRTPHNYVAYETKRNWKEKVRWVVVYYGGLHLRRKKIYVPMLKTHNLYKVSISYLHIYYIIKIFFCQFCSKITK